MQNYDSLATREIACKLLCSFVFTLFVSFNSVCAQSYGVDSGPVIVLDPGHGGKDSGTSSEWCSEKTVVLTMCKMIRELLADKMPEAAVFLTRETDEFIPLKQRAGVANELDADLFISVHCNAFPANPRITRGTETYVMGVHKTAENFEVAKRENESILFESDHDHSEFELTENHILLSHIQSHNLQKSIDFGKILEHNFEKVHPGGSKGVKQAGFMVLHQISMPGVLVETGYLSHPDEAKYLCSVAGQMKIAHSISDAILELFQVQASHPVIAYQEGNVKRKGTAQSSDDRRIFKVQLGVMSSEPNEHDIWSNYPEIEIVREGQFWKAMAGSFLSQQDAQKAKEEWFKEGFKDAFVVSFKAD